MKNEKLKRYSVLTILFFLPVAFLLILYPSTHNYEPLEIVNNNIKDITSSNEIKLKDHITVLAFFGNKPIEKAIAGSNLKELVYDKFKGFKKFQIVVIGTEGVQEEYDKLNKEIAKYEDLKFWHYVFIPEGKIREIYSSLKSTKELDANLATDEVFIIDKDLNQRGRLDDREKREIEANKPLRELYAYNCIEVAEIKNKMSDDMRILFTEYRQKRKGKFQNSDSRRAIDLKQTDE
ncbi:hypothetical protein [Winogradskyella alexanderae]|uniref:Uncharacterized protein n=1 Tax=Winogradskyella alexanderae TaxID=2877123 RepID=A0ABS7XLT6_9FLAO|nr:hypothetical protein [Winogradskyella alexanderae]MCA0130963.1 hypothetical protein [Winogradskyella alexanderae]